MLKRVFKYAGIGMALLVPLMMLAGCEKKEAEAAYHPDYLILVNQDHPIDSDYVSTIELVDVDNVDGGTYQVEKTTCQAFKSLKEDLNNQGIEIGVDSAYRSVERQKEIMAEFIETYGEEYARKIVAEPGTSEHHTGLVIDIVPKVNGEWVVENDDMLKEMEFFDVIHKTMPVYGFILRYPSGKEDITGYSYEPWHLRYVGKEVAEEIYDRQITLEEYVSDKNRY